jgi:DNA-directed RNA polymerase specialized sigma24 family protein
MMARTSTTKISARERARAAKARLDAEERDHQKLVEDAVVSYYEGEDARDAAHEALAAAETGRAAAVNAISELGESVTRIASLTGLDASEVRKLKRTASMPGKDDDSAGESDVEATAADDPSTGPSALAS